MKYLIAYIICALLCFIFAKFRYKDPHVFWFGLIPISQQIALLFIFWDLFNTSLCPFTGKQVDRINAWFER